LRLLNLFSNCSKISFLILLDFGHSNRKWSSSSTSRLHNLHILCDAGIFLYRPHSISSWCELMLENKFNNLKSLD
jgi:hypothetical protein